MFAGKEKPAWLGVFYKSADHRIGRTDGRRAIGNMMAAYAIHGTYPAADDPLKLFGEGVRPAEGWGKTVEYFAQKGLKESLMVNVSRI